MVKYELYAENDNIITYHYFPEGHEDYGTITMDKKTADLVEVELAKSDKFKQYFYHMINEIEEFIEKGKYLKAGYVAWY